MDAVLPSLRGLGSILSNKDPYGTEQVKNVHFLGCNCTPNNPGSQTGKRPSFLKSGKDNSLINPEDLAHAFREAASSSHRISGSHSFGNS